jgi:hypothetical protein
VCPFPSLINLLMATFLFDQLKKLSEKSWFLQNTSFSLYKSIYLLSMKGIRNCWPWICQNFTSLLMKIMRNRKRASISLRDWTRGVNSNLEESMQNGGWKLCLFLGRIINFFCK